MSRKMYQGGSSRKQAPRLAMREPDLEPPREAQVRPCEWSSDEFMVRAGFKDEFYAYIQNASLEDFLPDKCLQYYYLTDSFMPAILILSYLISMINLIRWTKKIFAMHAKFHNGVFLASLTNLNIMISLLASPLEKLEISHKPP